MDDIQKLAGALFEQFEGYIGKALAPIRAKLIEIEARPPEKGEKGDAGPAGEKGADGAPGRDGKDGEQGPAGAKGEPGDIGPAGPVGEKGTPGADGVGLAGALVDRDGNLVLTLTNGETKALGRVVGKDGADGLSVKADDLAALVRAEVQKSVAHIEALGPGADPEALQGLIDKAVANAVAAMPAPEPGPPGRDADPELITRMVSDAVSAMPKPADGKSVTAADIEPMLADLVAKAVAAIPAPKDGAPGKDADPAMIERIVADRVEKAIAALPKPQDGRDGRDGAPGRDGEDGAKGLDGLGFDDMQFDYDGERHLVVRFVQGDRIKEFAATLPIIIDRGVYRPGTAYQRGDAISFGGALWISQKDTDAKPGSNADWRLAVKKGRDGRDGRAGSIMPATGDA